MEVKQHYRHQVAFEFYANAGSKRSYRQVAEHMGVSLAAVKNWAGTENWQQRICERDAESARQLADRTLASGAVESGRNLKIVHLALLTLARSIREGKIKGQMADVDRLIRLEEHLLGGEGRLCRDPEHAAMTPVKTWTLEGCRDFVIDAAIQTARENPEALARLRREMETLANEPHAKT